MKVKHISSFFSKLNLSLILSVSVIVGILIVTATVTFAWFSGVVMNSDNKITTANISLSLMTLNQPINVTQLNLPLEDVLPLPKNTGDLFLNGNTLIPLNDNVASPRKFFEFNGQKSIEGVQPKFRQQRPLVVQNTSNSAVHYTLEFLTREVDNPGLSTAFFFNYTRLGGDIENSAMAPGGTAILEQGDIVDNLGVHIKKIGGDIPIIIKANSTHIYMVDMGISETAGNSYQGAGLILDIVLSTSSASHSVRPITDQVSFLNATTLNSGGDTFVLTKDLTITKAIVSNNVFNLDLNGNTLTFAAGATLTITYPNSPATIDIGSDRGGRILNPSAMNFVGVKDKSVLNWYTDITGVDFPTNASNIILNLKTVTFSNDTSSEDSASSSTIPSGYLDYTKLEMSTDYAGGNGTVSAPYQIETPQQFKRLVEDESLSSYFIINQTISNITNVPQKIQTKKGNIKFSDDTQVKNINVIGVFEGTQTIKLFSSAVLYNNGKKIVTNFDIWFSNISYNGVLVE